MWGKQKEQEKKNSFELSIHWKRKKKEKSEFLGPNLSLQALHC